MKKTIFLTLILTLALAACGSAAEATPLSSPAGDPDPNTGELPLSLELAIGTLKLEDTPQAVAPDQAAELLPLWQVLNSLLASDTAASQEVEAVLEQIQETLTPEQLSAIEAMQLTREDMFAAMQAAGIESGGAGNRAEGSGGEFMGAGPPEGVVPGSGPGGGQGGGQGFGPGGGELTPEQIATAQARRAESGGAGFGSGMLTPLVEAVIELLESKMQ